MKKFLLISFLSVLAILEVNAQITALGVTATIVAPTACTPPCNGSATAIVTGGTPPYTYLWNIPLAPQMTQTATGLCPGTYQCGVFDSSSPLPNQGQALVTVTCNTANGISTILAEENLSVYPNPAFNVLTVDFNSTQTSSSEFVVKSVLGAVAHKGILEAGSSSVKVDISVWPSGVYMIEILGRENSVTTKFIKQ